MKTNLMKTNYTVLFIIISIISFGQKKVYGRLLSLDELAIHLNGSTSTEESYMQGIQKRRAADNKSISSWEKDYLNKKIKNSTSKKERDSLEKVLKEELEFERVLLEQEKLLELEIEKQRKTELQKQQKIKAEKEYEELMINGVGISVVILVLFGFGMWKLIKKKTR